jgi:hypothetical protein
MKIMKIIYNYTLEDHLKCNVSPNRLTPHNAYFTSNPTTLLPSLGAGT